MSKHGAKARARAQNLLTRHRAFIIKALPVLAAIHMLGFAMLGAANNGYLSAIMVLVQALFAGVVFVVLPLERAWLQSIWPVNLAWLMLAIWASLPWLGLRGLQPPLSPDLYQLSLLTCAGRSCCLWR
jgi:hypothetical protein